MIAARAERTALTTVSWILLGCLVVAPLTFIVLYGIFPHVQHGSLAAPFSRWPDVLQRSDLLGALGNSLELAVLVVLESAVLGLASAYILAHDDLPGRSALGLLLFLPFLTPPFVGALAWTLVMQPNGFAQQIVHLPAEQIQTAFFSIWGIATVMALHLFPLVMLPTRVALQQVGSRHALVARLAGASAWQSFRRVTLPLVLPSLLGGCLLTFAASLEEFGVAATLGRQANVWVATTEIDRLVRTFPSDPSLAATLCIFLMTLTLGAFAVQRRVLRTAGRSATGRATPLIALRLNRWRAPAAGALLLLACVSGIIPWLGVLLASVLRALGGGMQGSNFTLDRFAALATDPVAQGSLATSAEQAAVGATAATLLGLLIAYLDLRLQVRLRRSMDVLSLLPSAVPAIVVAVAVLTLWNLSGVPDALYSSSIVLGACYTVLYLPIAVRYSAGGLATRPASLETAARTCGAGPVTTFRRILLPSIWPWLLAGWLTVFAIAMRELVASLLVRPPGTSTTSVYVYLQFEQSDPGQGMAMALVTLVVTCAILLIAGRVARPSTGTPSRLF